MLRKLPKTPCMWLKVALAFGILILMGLGTSVYRRGPAQSVSLSSLQLEPEERSDDLDFAKLREILRTHQFERIADLIQYLSKHHGPFMERHTFGFDSRSLHGSSYENPRAIVYGRSAEFVLTFNGDPSQAKYRFLEVAQFNLVSKSYDFFEVEFREGRPNIAFAHQFSDRGGPQNICMSCHVGGRPLWNEYLAWPGFYGGVNDQPLRPDARPIPEFAGFSSQRYLASEAEQWSKFSFGNRLTNPRYKWLPKPIDGRLPISGEPLRPNSDLATRLTRINMLRVVQSLSQEKPKIAELTKWELLYSQDCLDHPSPKVQEVWGAIKKRYAVEIAKMQDDIFKERVETFVRYASAPYFNFEDFVVPLYRSNYQGVDTPVPYRYVSNPVMVERVSQVMSKLHRCLSEYQENLEEVLQTRCLDADSREVLKAVKFGNFAAWMHQNGFGLKTELSRIGYAAAILKRRNPEVGSAHWSMTFGTDAQTYATESGFEVSLFRDGLVDQLLSEGKTEIPRYQEKILWDSSRLTTYCESIGLNIR